MLQKQEESPPKPPPPALAPKVAERARNILKGKAAVNDQEFMAAIDKAFTEHDPQGHAAMVAFLRGQVFGK